MKTFLVNEEFVNSRLDAFLAKSDSSFSREYYQLAITDSKVQVNDKVVTKPSYRLCFQDKVSFEELEEKPLNVVAENIALDIIYEDQDLLVINKPRGMVVHPSNGHYDGGTLVNALLYHCKDLSSINGVVRPGIVHRIDKDTSGLLVVAKNDKAHLFLQDQLKDKTMNRVYLALVEGIIPHQDIEIVAPIGKDKNDRLKQAIDIYHGKDAVTNLHVEKEYKNYTLVRCQLQTGRTHQIRVHLQYINHPCVGDKVYGKRKQELTQLGQMLCAIKITFIHPSTHQKMTFEVDLDPEFKRVLNLLEN